jgi:hypothetical protein
LDWLGLASPDDWQGRSLAKAACGALPSRTLIAGADLQHRFIRRGRWKLFVRGSVDRRLFDLSADPQETNDLSLAYPEIVRSLDAALLSLSAEQAQLRINSEFPQ